MFTFMDTSHIGHDTIPSEILNYKSMLRLTGCFSHCITHLPKSVRYHGNNLKVQTHVVCMAPCVVCFVFVLAPVCTNTNAIVTNTKYHSPVSLVIYTILPLLQVCWVPLLLHELYLTRSCDKTLPDCSVCTSVLVSCVHLY